MIVDMTPEHIYAVTRNICELDRRELLASGAGLGLDGIVRMTLSLPGPSFTALVNGEPVMVGGFSKTNGGAATAWMWGTDNAKYAAVEFTRFSKRAVKYLLENGVFHRIQAFPAVFHTRAARWIEAIGMKREATLRKYGCGGEDFYLYAAIKE